MDERLNVQLGGMPAVSKALFEVTCRQLKCKEKIDKNRNKIKLLEAEFEQNRSFQQFLVDEKKRLDKEALERDMIEILLDTPATPQQQEIPQDESSSTRPMVITPNIKLWPSGSLMFTPVQSMSPALLKKTYTPNSDPFLANITPSPFLSMQPKPPLDFSNSPANVMTLPPETQVPTKPTPLTMPALEMETQDSMQLELHHKKDSKKRKLDDF